MELKKKKFELAVPGSGAFLLLVILEIVLLVHSAPAHEPLFGLGPHTIYQHGYALESQLEKGDGGWANHLELIYGITPDLAVTLAAPYLFASGGVTAGFGDLTFRGKWRFFRHDMPGASNQAAIHLGVKTATGDFQSGRSSGTTDYFGGFSFGHESRRNYYFANALFRMNGEYRGVKRGNLLSLNAAYGIRPWLLEYLQPDPVFLLEFIGDFQGKRRINQQEDPQSGGTVLSLAPGLLFSYRNIMVKAGVKIPVLIRLNGGQENPGNQYILGLEFHFPPLF